MDSFFNIILILLILGGLLSFTFFIRRLLINSSLRNNHSKDIETKLDKIIDLLERDQSKL